MPAINTFGEEGERGCPTPAKWQTPLIHTPTTLHSARSNVYLNGLTGWSRGDERWVPFDWFAVVPRLLGERFFSMGFTYLTCQARQRKPKETSSHRTPNPGTPHPAPLHLNTPLRHACSVLGAQQGGRLFTHSSVICSDALMLCCLASWPHLTAHPTVQWSHSI